MQEALIPNWIYQKLWGNFENRNWNQIYYTIVYVVKSINIDSLCQNFLHAHLDSLLIW